MTAKDSLAKLKQKKEKLEKQIKETEVLAQEEERLNARALALGLKILEACDVDEDVLIEFIKNNTDVIAGITPKDTEEEGD